VIVVFVACGGAEPVAAQRTLNEVMTGDAAGDWVELAGDRDVAGWSLVDADGGAPWEIADESVDGHLVIDLAGDGVHGPFRLNLQGGSLLLFDEDGELVDQVRYPKAEEGTSWARIPDLGPWDRATPTPGASNG
jgi:hypothetical protein